MRDQHDSVSCCNSEKRDEAHQRCDRQSPSRNKYHDHAADQRERKIGHDEQRKAARLESQIKKEKNSSDRHNAHDHDLSGRLFLGFKLPAVLDEVPFRECDIVSDLLPDFVDY